MRLAHTKNDRIDGWSQYLQQGSQGSDCSRNGMPATVVEAEPRQLRHIAERPELGHVRSGAAQGIGRDAGVMYMTHVPEGIVQFHRHQRQECTRANIQLSQQVNMYTHGLKCARLSIAPTVASKTRRGCAGSRQQAGREGSRQYRKVREARVLFIKLQEAFRDSFHLVIGNNELRQTGEASECQRLFHSATLTDTQDLQPACRTQAVPEGLDRLYGEKAHSRLW